MSKFSEKNDNGEGPEPGLNIGSFGLGFVSSVGSQTFLGLLLVNLVHLDFYAVRLLFLAPMALVPFLMFTRQWPRRIKEPLLVALLGYFVGYVFCWLMSDWGYVAENANRPINGF